MSHETVGALVGFWQENPLAADIFQPTYRRAQVLHFVHVTLFPLLVDSNRTDLFIPATVP